MKRPLRKLEPARGIIHGAGQSPEAFQDYCRCVGPEVQPLIYMT
jgi:hypothetical protein